MSRRLVPVLALLAVGATACAGPEQRVEFGGKAVPINVAFGKPPSDGTPSPGAAAPVLQPGPGGIGVVPVLPVRGPSPMGVPSFGPDPSTPPPAPTPSCPPQDPLAFPQREATNVVSDPVPEGSFPYRVTGSFTVNGKKTPYAGTDVQVVKRLENDAAGRARYSMSYVALGVPYTVTYAITPPLEAFSGEIGLESVVRESADGSGASFRPVEPLRLLQLRAERDARWTEAASDPLSASSATADGTIAGKVRLNACGKPVEAWKAVVTQRTITPGQDITATRTLYFATGYGGLLVGEQVSYSGTAGGDQVSGSSTSTINVDPGLAR
jgi:hypothetical protein